MNVTKPDQYRIKNKAVLLMIITNLPMKAISFPSGETSNLAVLCSEPEVLVRQGTYSILLFPLIKLVICNHLNTLTRQHVVDEEVWVEL